MIKFLLTFGFIAVCSAAHDNAFARLFDDLFDDAGYDPKIIPMEKPAAGNGNNAVNLGLGLSLLNIGLDDVGNLDVNAWLRASWKDYRLMWDPAQYEGIKSINVPAQVEWKPCFQEELIEYLLFNKNYWLVRNAGPGSHGLKGVP